MPFTPTRPEREHEQVEGKRRYDEGKGHDPAVVEHRQRGGRLTSQTTYRQSSRMGYAIAVPEAAGM